MEITKEDNTTKDNPLTTEVQKMDWLNKRIKNLEYLLEYDSNVDAEDVECDLQMFRELLSIKIATCRASAVKKIKDNLHFRLPNSHFGYGHSLASARLCSPFPVPRRAGFPAYGECRCTHRRHIPEFFGLALPAEFLLLLYSSRLPPCSVYFVRKTSAIQSQYSVILA